MFLSSDGAVLFLIVIFAEFQQLWLNTLPDSQLAFWLACLLFPLFFVRLSQLIELDENAVDGARLHDYSARTYWVNWPVPKLKERNLYDLANQVKWDEKQSDQVWKLSAFLLFSKLVEDLKHLHQLEWLNHLFQVVHRQQYENQSETQSRRDDTVLVIPMKVNYSFLVAFPI